METAKIGTADRRRITAVMDRLGCKRDNDGKADWQGKRWSVSHSAQHTTAHYSI
jgi:hypothetical protein